jgi:hypothetical protein
VIVFYYIELQLSEPGIHNEANVISAAVASFVLNKYLQSVPYVSLLYFKISSVLWNIWCICLYAVSRLLALILLFFNINGIKYDLPNKPENIDDDTWKTYQENFTNVWGFKILNPKLF